MKIRTTHIIATAVALTMTGCLETPEPGIFAYRPNTTNGQKVEASTQCKVLAVQQVPVNTQIATTPTYTTPVLASPTYTSCSGSSYGGGSYTNYAANCTTTGGGMTGGQTYGGQVYSYDANQDLRHSVYDQCMRKKGFEIIQTKSCISTQIPEGLSASLSDKVIRPEGKFCTVPFDGGFGVPVKLE